MIYSITILLPFKRPVSAIPLPAKTAETMVDSFTPILRLKKLPKRPPKQKEHIVIVKLRESCCGSQPKSVAKGTLRIDQAYIIPAKSIATTDTVKIIQR